MKIKNVGPRTVTIQGVGIWEEGEVKEIHDPAAAAGLLRNEFFAEVGPRGGTLRPESRAEKPAPQEEAKSTPKEEARPALKEETPYILRASEPPAS